MDVFWPPKSINNRVLCNLLGIEFSERLDAPISLQYSMVGTSSNAQDSTQFDDFRFRILRARLLEMQSGEPIPPKREEQIEETERGEKGKKEKKVNPLIKTGCSNVKIPKM